MDLLIEREGGIATITLNRPEKLNALTNDMRTTLSRTMEELKDPAVKVVVLRGAGRGFCAGSDVSSMGKETIVSGRRRLQLAHSIVRGIATLEKPVIAAVRGPAVGIGWSLALACDVILASETAVFSQVFRRIGLAPDGGSVFLLAKYVGVLRAKEIALTARKVGAEEAMRLGLVTEVMPDDQLESRTEAFARDLEGAATFAIGMTKRLFVGAENATFDTFLELESHVQNQLITSADHREGIAAFVEKRPAVFTGT